MNGKCEWLQLCITRIRDQQHSIFGERQLPLKIIKSFKQKEELRWINQQGMWIKAPVFSLKITLSSGLNKEDHIIIAQVGFLDAIGRSWQINRGSVLSNMASSTNQFENYWKRLGEMEKRRVGTRFIDREATEEDQAKPLMQVLAEKGITCSIMWHKLFRHHQTVASILRDGWWQTLFGAKF